MTTQHIGAAGELLVQYQLLKLDIDSSRLTTDSGVDLVVYAPTARTAWTVQVKTNQRAHPAGGSGPLSRNWYFPRDCHAQLLALAALDVDRVWLLTLDEARERAQQLSPKGVHQIYWRAEGVESQARSVLAEEAMSQYLLTNRARMLFP